MKVCFFAFLFLLSASGRAQSLSDRKSSIFTWTHTLDAADLLLRSADIYTTHRNLTNPCRCFYEADPLAPSTSSLAAEAAFFYGSGLLVVAGDRAAQHSPRRWLRRSGRLLLLADILSEAIAIAHNNTQLIPAQVTPQ